MNIDYITGGVCAPKGFSANGIHCGIRKNKDKRDLALIFSDRPASAAAIYTKNRVQSAPITVTRKNLSDATARAMICNSGNANACNTDGVEIAEKTCSLLAKAAGIDPGDVIVASTGVIGQPLSIRPFEENMAKLVEGLGDHCDYATEAIMTTDTRKKEIAVGFELGGVPCRLGGIAKGSGMIHPNMATMLVFLTTDAAISPRLLQKALAEDADVTFNMISVDGDTSTNDMVSVLANGAANNAPVTAEGEDFQIFKTALNIVTTHLCKAIARDGEGATKLLECAVQGASDPAIAGMAAKSVISSSLVKAAMFGADANCGRVLCALGYSGADIDVNKIDVVFRSRAGRIEVCKDGVGLAFSEEKAKTILLEEEITIEIDLNGGHAGATSWGCDLTYDYVKINGDYRS